MSPPTSLFAVLAAAALAAASGVPALFLARSSRLGPRIAALAAGAAALLGLAGAASALRGGPAEEVVFAWPAAGGASVGLDPLSGWFLVPIFAMGGLGAVYGLAYWAPSEHPGSARTLPPFWGLLVAGMALLVVSRHWLSFLLGWEVMALSAFFLIGAEHRRAECRRAALLYIVATHVATLALFALAAGWRAATGSFALQPLGAEAIGVAARNGLFALALLAFGLKAGMMPLHFWLPSAHAAAPSHVSAVLSGVVLKMGIYGLLRFLALLPPPPPAWGTAVLALGAASGVLGVLFAIGQHDLKRLLAYHSVENIGIILMGLGLAMLGRAAGRAEWVVLGMSGCLLHVLNHGLFKGLLFLGAGSVVHRTRTREIDRLGGLAKAMPWTAAAFLAGAVAICGLPPMNGFVSELLVYLGLLRAGTGDGAVPALMIGAPTLALIGALAVACFVKVFGAVFLGSARGGPAAAARESPLAMRAPMAVLVAGCAAVGLAPGAVASFLDAAVAGASPQGAGEALPSVAAFAPLGAVGAASLGLAAALALLAAGAAARARRAPSAHTWDCGYARPTARMQYTASSFAQMVVALFGWALRPRVERPSVRGPFPPPARLSSHVDDLVLDRVIAPAGRRIERWAGWIRRFQRGVTQLYVLYILIAVVAMLATLVPIGSLLDGLLGR